MPEQPAEVFWRVPIATLFDRVQANAAGLTATEATARLARYGPNSVVDAPRMRIAVKVAKRFAEPLVAILLVAAAISGLTGDVASFVIILIVVALSIILDVVQEQRAEVAAEALKRSVAIHADVRRDGKVVRLLRGDFEAETPGGRNLHFGIRRSIKSFRATWSSFGPAIWFRPTA